MAAALALAWHHPLFPGWAMAALVAWAAAVYRYPGAWLFVVPAALPALNLAPWTGWVVFEEFDLLLLGVAAGGYARRALARQACEPVSPRRPETWLAVALALLTAVALVRGFLDAGTLAWGWFDGHTDPLNSLRIAKPIVFALLLAPLAIEQLRDRGAVALRRFAAGVLAGLVVVTLAALWERAAYPGLWNFTRPYRTTALFWEMHVGGAAIDAYFALVTPFLVWGLWTARTPLRWAGAALLTLAAGYAVLTTFSRGLYAAVVVSLLVLATLAWTRRRRAAPAATMHAARRMSNLFLAAAGAALVATVLEKHGAAIAFASLFAIVLVIAGLRRVQPRGWRTTASLALGLALALEVLLVLEPGSFMLRRLSTSERDSTSRGVHWRNGVGLLSSWDDWLFGIGLGRLPANYARRVPGGEFPGAVALVDSPADHEASVRVSGPPTRRSLGGLYGLSQRVATESSYRFEFDVRADALADVYARVCEVHLLYEMRCQWALVRVGGGDPGWQRMALALRGPVLSGGSGPARRQAVFNVSVSNPGGAAEFDRLVLLGAGNTDLLRNGDFSNGLAGWLASATQYYVPWHIDNLVLEVLVERGLATLAVLVSLLSLASRRLAGPAGRCEALQPFLVASLAGLMSVGMVSSVLEVPRVAFLACLIVTLSFGLRAPARCGATSEPERFSLPVQT